MHQLGLYDTNYASPIIFCDIKLQIYYRTVRIMSTCSFVDWIPVHQAGGSRNVGSIEDQVTEHKPSNHRSSSGDSS